MRDITRTHGNLLEDLPKLGPVVRESVPPPEQAHGPPLELDVEDDQNLNSKYALSGRQREIIKTHESIERADQNDNILQKRDRLPERVQHLIDDVVLLSNSPYFSTERWHQGQVDRKGTRSKWENFATERQKSDFDLENLDPDSILDFDESEVEYYETPFESPSELWAELIDIDQRSQQVRSDVFFAGHSVTSDEVQFGYELGSLLQMLRPTNEVDSIGMDLIWGFILAFIGQSRREIEKERELLDQIITEMNDRHESREKEADLILDLQEIMEQRTEEYRMTAEAIEEMGIEPHPIVVEEVLYHQTEFGDDENLHKGNAQKTLSKIEDVVPLRVIDNLYSRLTVDIPTIQNKTTQEIESLDRVIEAFEVAQSDEDSSANNRLSVGSKTIGDVISNVNVRMAAMTHVLNRLSDGEGGELWTTTPIVVQKENGNWQLTAYGTLLLHIMKNHQGDPSAVYRFAIGPEEISLQDRKLILEVLEEENNLTGVAS